MEFVKVSVISRKNFWQVKSSNLLFYHDAYRDKCLNGPIRCSWMGIFDGMFGESKFSCKFNELVVKIGHLVVIIADLVVKITSLVVIVQ